MIRRDTHISGGLFDELVIDNFAGGGGASIGLERANVVPVLQEAIA